MPGVADTDRWAVFDLFGVIVKEGHIVRNVLYPLCKDVCDLSYEELELLYLKYRVGKISQEEFNRYVPAWLEERIFENVEVDRDAERLLKFLKRMGIKTGIITNKPKHWGEKILEELEEEAGVDLVVASGEVGVAKPDPRIYEIFLERSGARPENVVYVDDKVQNLVPASRLGMRTVLFVREGADFLAKSPKSLRDIILSFRDGPLLD